MKSLRQFHLSLGCLFAPLVIYFALSGTWQVFRLNDIPKDEPPSYMQSVFHELSKPHTSSTLPGLNPKQDSSTAFRCVALLAALGLIATAAIGIALALRSSRSPIKVLLLLGAGIVLPVLLLFLR